MVGISILLCIVIPGAARAQPGRAPVPAPAPAPAPPSSPYGPSYGPSYGSSYAYGPNYYLLTAEERELLMEGEISSGQTIGGGILSLWLGLGIGHAVQGRYSSVGWKFTLGELAAIGGIYAGLGMSLQADGFDNGQGLRGEDVMIVSLIGYLILRGWDAIDAFVGPGEHNRKVRAARWKANGYGGAPRYGFYVAPGRDHGGGTAGLSLRF